MFRLSDVPALVVVITLLPLCQSYLVDEVNPVIFSGTADSYFGYSLSFHSHGTTKALLVGSPKSVNQYPVTGVTRRGALVRCPLAANGRAEECDDVIVDLEGNEKTLDGRVTEDKSHMWLGSAVASAGPDQQVLVCARAYKQIWYWPNREGLNGTDAIHDDVGRCYLLPSALDDMDEIQVVQACNYFGHSIGPGLYWLSQCGVGDSIDVLDTSKTAILDTENDTLANEVRSYQFAVGGASQLIGRGQAFLVEYNTSNSNASASVRTTGFPHTNNYKDTYFGYAVSQGDIDGDGLAELAVSRPGASIGGNVWILPAQDRHYSTYFSTHFNRDDDLLVEINSEEVREYFGYSMANADVNGDGKSELLVGAPLYAGSAMGKRHKGVFDAGHVYVFASNLTRALKQRHSSGREVRLNAYEAAERVLQGREHSWFGSAISSLGDMDCDGYEDVAIGAPFEHVSNSHTGAVYLYFGSATGLLPVASQKITGESIGSSVPLSGLGFAISRRWDIDDNSFNDLAIGVPFSSKAVVLRSRPAIEVTMWILILKSLEKEVAYCDIAELKNAICTTVAICASYTSKGEDVDAEVIYHANINGSMVFGDITSSKSHLTGSLKLRDQFPSRKCTNHIVALPISGRPCQPTDVYISEWNLVDKPSTPSSLTPVLLQNTYKLPPPATIKIASPCSGCVPNMRIEAGPLLPGTGILPLVLGREDHVILQFDVANVRNDRTAAACNPLFKLALPLGLTFKRVVQGRVLVCSPDVDAGEVSCLMRQVLLPGAVEVFTLELSVDRVLRASTKRFLDVHIFVEGSNGDQDIQDNLYVIHTKVSLEASIALSGDSHQKQVEISKAGKPGQDRNSLDTGNPELRTGEVHKPDGPFMDHSYVVFNQGPSPIPITKVLLRWPLKLDNGSPLLFLAAFRTNLVNLSCNYSSLLQHHGYNSSGIDGVVKKVIDLTSDAEQTLSKVACSYLGELCYVDVHCTLPPMAPETAGIIQATWRVSMDLTMEERKRLPLKVDTCVELLKVNNASNFAHIPTDKHMARVVTVIYEIYTKPRGELKWWIILVAVAIGFFLLLVCISILYKDVEVFDPMYGTGPDSSYLISIKHIGVFFSIFLCYLHRTGKCGFFKRKKIDQSVEQKVGRASIQ